MDPNEAKVESLCWCHYMGPEGLVIISVVLRILGILNAGGIKKNIPSACSGANVLEGGGGH